MKVLIVCSATKGSISPFIKEQVDSLSSLGDITFSYFTIKQCGTLGYLKHLPLLYRSILYFKPDLIHAHYGLSGLLANLQRKVPVITTFHGSDVNIQSNLKWSILANKLSSASIFVEESMMSKFKNHNKSVVIPCGVDLSNFFPIPISQARERLKMKLDDIYIVFSSDFLNPIKNYYNAQLACNLAEKKIGKKIYLIELKDFSRDVVNLILNAANCALLFSKNEGSPQFIKEAMACNCPIVATNVGDIELIIKETKGCYITHSSIENAAEKITEALDYSKEFGRTKGRERIHDLSIDIDSISRKIERFYYYI